MFEASRPWVAVTQYYHLNARMWIEPQGAVGFVGDSSHLHLWLKLYYSLFPSISPFGWKIWRLMNLVYSLASKSVWTSFALLSWNLRIAMRAESCEKFCQTTVTLFLAPCLSQLFGRSVYCSLPSSLLHTMISWCKFQFFPLLSYLENSYSLEARMHACTRTLRPTPHSRRRFRPDCWENIPNDRLFSSGLSCVR